MNTQGRLRVAAPPAKVKIKINIIPGPYVNQG
jgi:hypothetical protein